MGNEQSTQAGAKQEESDATENKPWDPDKATPSEDEGAAENGRAFFTKGTSKPESDLPRKSSPRLRSAKKSQPQEKNKKKAKTLEEIERDERSDSETAIAHAYSVTAATTKERTPVKVAEELDEEGGVPKEPISQPISRADDLYGSQFEATKQDSISEQGTPIQTPLQIRSRKSKDLFPCPEASTHDCDETFTSQRAANKHAESHSNQLFQCIVCAKILNRADKLKEHELLHSKEELEDAARRDQGLGIGDSEGEDEDNGTLQQYPNGSGHSGEQPDTAEKSHKSGSNSATPTPQDTSANDEEAQTSTRISTSSASLFDEPADIEMIQETPRPKSGLKRKRNALGANLSIGFPANNSHKRRRKHSLSPPTSVASDEEEAAAGVEQATSNNDIVIPVSASVPKITKLKSAKLGNLDSFAKPWTPGSQLHHPIHNPRSPRVKSSQRVQIATSQNSHAESSSRATAASQKNLIGVTSGQLDDNQTPLAEKGKPVVYTSPKGKQRAEDGVIYSSPLKTAATIVDRGSSKSAGMATTVARRTNVSQTDRKRPKKIADENEENGDEIRKGHFSASEIQRIEGWRHRFCQEHDIDISSFNQMMTDSSRRSKTTPWPYRFISRADFIKEYLETLPNRDKKSMFRYRERSFQNVPSNQEWSKEDDNELIRLVAEIGPKWVEIGQLMTRTQDSISQRWHLKLKYQGGINQGEWLKSEELKLKEAVAQVKRELGLPQDPTADVRIPWDSVRKKLNSKRTAQQCSNKWRLMHYKRSGTKFVLPIEAGNASPPPSDTTTPSRISQRLAGQTPSSLKSGSTQKRKFVSNERVHDSDDDESITDEQTGADVENSELRGEAGSPSRKALAKKTARKTKDTATKTKTPTNRRSGPTSRTPQIGLRLSQAFDQTQANTSALRAPNSLRQPHTQTEMPTPGMPIQRWPTSASSWRAINRDPSLAYDSDIESDQMDEDAIMAEPKTSDEDAQPSRSETDSSSSRSKSHTGSTSEDSSGSVPESENESSKKTMQDKFVRSLAIPSSIPKADLSKGRKGDRSLLANVFAKKGPQSDSESESDSDSEDEGDINHH